MARQDWTLVVGLAAIVVAIVGGSCSTNARIDGLAAHVDMRIDDVSGWIAELRTDFRRLDDRIRGVEVNLGQVEQRVGRLQQRVGAVGERLGGVEQRLGGVEQRLGGVEQRLGGVEQRLGGVERLQEPSPDGGG